MAQTEVGITKDLPAVTLQADNGPVTINRIENTKSESSGGWALTSRPCPDYCVQPHAAAEGVTAIGELELIEMLLSPDAVVAGSRTRDWFEGGTIPGAIHIPYACVVDGLAQLGCEPDCDGWDCKAAKPVDLFCNGIWCGQPPTAIRNMISAGYPANRIFYHRGSMQVWRLLGLTVIVSE